MTVEEFTSRMMSNLDGEKDAEIARLRKALVGIEYAANKASLTDSERLLDIRIMTERALRLPVGRMRNSQEGTDGIG